MAAPGMLMILTENHTMLDPRDMRALVELARIAEGSGFDAVMVSEQTMLGPDAAIDGLMSNPRMYAAIGNQDPMTPWPSSIATLAAVAAATSRVRVVAGAIIPPLRHPILLAKDLATIDLLCEGRLVVQPTVSWQRAEGLATAGRHISEIELIGGTRATFASPDAVADVDDAMAAIDEQIAAGYTLFCMKPSQYTDDIREVADICRRMVDYCGRCGA